MSDFRIKISVRNNLLLTALEKSEFRTVRKLSEAAGTSIAAVYDLLNITGSPLIKTGEWSGPALKIADALGVLPDELFTEAHYKEIATNKAEFVADYKDMALLAETITPDILLERKALTNAVNTALATLGEREATAIRMRMDGSTYDEIGKVLDVTRERVRQIVMKAERKLRNPNVAERVALEEFCKTPKGKREYAVYDAYADY